MELSCGVCFLLAGFIDGELRVMGRSPSAPQHKLQEIHSFFPFGCSALIHSAPAKTSQPNLLFHLFIKLFISLIK